MTFTTIVKLYNPGSHIQKNCCRLHHIHLLLPLLVLLTVVVCRSFINCPAQQKIASASGLRFIIFIFFLRRQIRRLHHIHLLPPLLSLLVLLTVVVCRSFINFPAQQKIESASGLRFIIFIFFLRRQVRRSPPLNLQLHLHHLPHLLALLALLAVVGIHPAMKNKVRGHDS